LADVTPARLPQNGDAMGMRLALILAFLPLAVLGFTLGRADRV
jgi:hypothetical protein